MSARPARGSGPAAAANDHVLVVPLIESVRAVGQMTAMAAVPGTEVFFFGPSDFSATAGHRGQWEGPGVAEQILALKDVLRHARGEPRPARCHAGALAVRGKSQP